MRNILKLWDSTKIVGRSQNEMVKTLIFLTESMYSFILTWDKLLPYKKSKNIKHILEPGPIHCCTFSFSTKSTRPRFFFKKKICQQEILIVKKQKKRNASGFLCCYCDLLLKQFRSKHGEQGVKTWIIRISNSTERSR